MPLPTIDLNQCEWSCIMRARPVEMPFRVPEDVFDTPGGWTGHMAMQVVTTDATYEQINRDDNVWIDIHTGDVVRMDHSKLRVDDA